MEYLEGQTLAERLSKGALPIDQGLGVAIEIADALDSAHRAGIVHRDLKPGNTTSFSSKPPSLQSLENAQRRSLLVEHRLDRHEKRLLELILSRRGRVAHVIGEREPR
jgi:serine/threonine protein kinase